MEGLRYEVTCRVRQFIREYVEKHADAGDLFRGMGRAYIRLAKDEPHLFKIFILRQRDGISSLDDLYQSEAGPDMAAHIAEKLNVSLPQARQLHLNMLIYTIGLGTVFAVTTPGILADEILERQEDAYQAFLAQIRNEEKGDCDEK